MRRRKFIFVSTLMVGRKKFAEIYGEFFLLYFLLFCRDQLRLETFSSRSPHVVKHKSLVQMASFWNCNGSVQKPQSFIYVFDCCFTFFPSVIGWAEEERRHILLSLTHLLTPKRHLPNLMLMPRKLISEMFQDRFFSYQNFGTKANVIKLLMGAPSFSFI